MMFVITRIMLTKWPRVAHVIKIVDSIRAKADL